MKRGTRQRPKKMMMMSCWEMVTSVSFFPIYGQFKGVGKLISRCTACKTYSFINSSNKISNKALMLLLWVKVLFSPSFRQHRPTFIDLFDVSLFSVTKQSWIHHFPLNFCQLQELWMCKFHSIFQPFFLKIAIN